MSDPTAGTPATPDTPDTAELVVAEREVEAALGPAATAALATVRARWAFVDDGDDVSPEYRALGADPAYAELAEHVVRRTAARARAVQTGEVPYVADRAFTPEEARVVERAVATGLWLDAPWVADAVAALADVSVAPGDARSLPSQAVCYAIARSVREAPTPESVAALAAVATSVRHAGVRKKLARYVPAARRNLAARPDVALRLPAGTAPTRTQVTAWTRTLESSWLLGTSWPASVWAATVHGVPATSRVAADLVWAASGVGSFRGVPGALVDAAGGGVDLPDDAHVRLWHPAAASAEEREAWRAHLWRERLQQPFRQVLREHYVEGDAGFVDAVVDATQLVGVARREGWTTDPDGLTRTSGSLRAEISTDMHLYPGVAGVTQVRDVRVGHLVRVQQGTRWYAGLGPAEPGTLPAVPVSELLRSVDLLVSTSAVAREHSGRTAVPGGTPSPAGVLGLRRSVLGHVLADLEPADAGRVRLDARHVVVDAARVHLATARVTRDGDPVEIEPTTAHGLWTPKGDPLLARIVGLVVTLLRAG